MSDSLLSAVMGLAEKVGAQGEAITTLKAEVARLSGLVVAKPEGPEPLPSEVASLIGALGRDNPPLYRHLEAEARRGLASNLTPHEVMTMLSTGTTR